MLYFHQMGWQEISQANARRWLVRVLAVGCTIFVVLEAVGRLSNATYMADGHWEIFLVSVAIAPMLVALYELVHSALKW
jgi:putative effector of murein hydrolase